MEWSRRLLKTNAKKAVSRNYWRYISVCFLTILICGSSYTSKLLFQRNFLKEMPAFTSEIFKDSNVKAILQQIFLLARTWLLRKESIISVTGVLLSVALWIVYKVFVANIVRVGSVRFMLESCTYPCTSVKKLGYLYRGNVIGNPAKIMLLMYVKRFLWWFTIIGGIIKTYEYSMIPYILAENPDISSKDAFVLSKRMMHGKKWGLFLLQLSFLPWFILGTITMGLTNIFYLNAYYGATKAEFYMRIRRDIVSQRNRYSRFFVDKYLENKPTEDEILINMFVLEKNYMPNLESEAFSQQVYPMFLRGRDSNWFEATYKKEKKKEYHVTTYILLFFVTSIAGWMLDAMLSFVQLGVCVVGGLTFGPWIPTVGIASIIIMVVGQKLAKHPLINVTFISVVASAAQYLYVWVVEIVKGTRYWDFSEFFLNINGRICLTSVVVVGALGTALFYVIGPGLNQYFEQFPTRKKWKICIFLLVIFIIDALCSVFFKYL